MHMEKDSGGRGGPSGYNHFARLLHWLVAGAIVLQFVLAKLAEAADEDGQKFRQLVLLANHKSVGMTILAVAVVRVLWRLLTPRPSPLVMPDWQRAAARLSHMAFYILLFAMPLSGWLMSSASNIPVSWFNVFQFPDPIMPNENLESSFAQAHELLGKALFVLAALHIAAALKHSLVDRDGAMRRISSPLGFAAFLLVVIAGIVLLIPESRAQESGVPAWDVDYDRSFIRFTAEQAGAQFEGEWQDWSATLRFTPDAPESGLFDVTIRVAGVSTRDQERDETLRDPEFFFAEQFPMVTYRADSFTVNADNTFTANGEIDVKGKTSPAPLTFSLERDGEKVTLVGSARLDRLQIGVGTDDWEDTDWIGQFVDVSVRVEGTAP